ncbi:hypothetical protein [Acrocarpospora catenulata]|uniref:hypothetical protein n=1 Tax=Acrocarpospora catenulata TaxID=2836182 RepID=UPI001BDA4EC2|nr:hypothetical protein [Acrocarpospora catenulata]
MERNPYTSPYDTRTEYDPDQQVEQPVPESPEPLAEEARREDALVAGRAETPGSPEAETDPDNEPLDNRDALADPHPDPAHDILAAEADTIIPEQRTPEQGYPPADAVPVEDFEARWRDIKAGFVDDPRDSVAKADTMLDEAVSALAARRQALLDGWKNNDENDTEQLRLALREYHELFARLKG